MRIGFDISPITASRTGVGNYCYYTLKHLLELAPEDAFYGFSSGLRRIVLDEMEHRLASHHHVQLPTRVMYAIWSLLSAPKVDRLLGGVDVYHATNYFLPPAQAARTVVSIYDLAFLVNPAWCSPKIVGPYSAGMRRFAAKADGIVVCSEATKRDVVHLLGVEPEKIAVMYGGVDERFAPVPREQAVPLLEQRYGVRPPFLLFVSTLEPRKNVTGLLHGFSRIVKDIPHQLVLLGSVGWRAEPIFQAIDELGLANRVVRPGFVPHEELPLFYGAADAFVFPSHYEGFGLPVLEAMTCACPVITSTTSSLPEVIGSAGLMVEPSDPDALAEAILEITGDKALRQELGRRGVEQAKRFSWSRCAQVVLDMYRRLAACSSS